jgi:DNA replication protein DnaC
MTTDLLLQRATTLQLYGLLAHWEKIREADWLEPLIAWEETERSHRSLQRRLVSSHIKHFKPLAHFDWDWPKECDREAIEELMELDFLAKSTNLVFCGPNGVGKSTIAKNICYQSVMRGHTALFITASQMLKELASLDGDSALQRRIKYYVQPALLCVDEVGYLSYSNRCADLFFEIVSQRYQAKSTMITTNKAFAEWGEIFPNASCIVSIIDRLVHNSEIISIDAPSYRLKESKEQDAKRKEARTKRATKPSAKNKKGNANES